MNLNYFLIYIILDIIIHFYVFIYSFVKYNCYTLIYEEFEIISNISFLNFSNNNLMKKYFKKKLISN